MPWTFFDKNGNQKQAAASVARPMARMTQASVQSMTLNVQALITFAGVGAADFDTYASVSPMWASGNPGRLTAPITGRYRITGSVAQVANAAQTNMGIEFRKNGVTALSGTTNGWVASCDGNSDAAVASIVVSLTAGDYIEVLYYNGGTTRNTITTGTWLALEYLDAAVVQPVAYPASLVGQEVAYAEITAPVTGISAATEATATTVITAPSFTADGVSKYKIEVFAPRVLNVSANGLTFVSIFDNGTSIGQVYESVNADSAGRNVLLNASRLVVPSAGAHVYTARVWASSSNAAVTAGAGGAGNYVPAYLRVTKAS